MTPTQRKAMEDARNALQRAAYTTDRPDILGLCEQADDALRAALAEADEPVAWMDADGNTISHAIKVTLLPTFAALYPVPLYTHPPRREPLTAEQIDTLTECVDFTHGGSDDWAVHFARAVERAHGIGGDE